MGLKCVKSTTNNKQALNLEMPHEPWTGTFCQVSHERYYTVHLYLGVSCVKATDNDGSRFLHCSSLAAQSAKLACSLSKHHRQEASQHSPLSKDWRTVSERIELACGLWQPAPTPRHLPVGYKACGSSCGSDRFYPGTLLQKPSPHCQLPAEKKERVTHWNTHSPSKIPQGTALAQSRQDRVKALVIHLNRVIKKYHFLE